MQFFTQTLPPKTFKLLRLFSEKKPNFLSYFYLSGGTSLSLQIGHRESEDLDFFCKDNFSPEIIEQQLSKYGDLEDTELSVGTLNTYFDGVKLQFLEYPYRIIEPLVKWDNIKLSSVLDIACTKLQTVGMRGSKKDFIDLYFLLQIYSLEDLFRKAKEKYKEQDYSETHILKSLIYFDDAEDQPIPKMHKNISWDEVKSFLTTTVKSINFQ